MRAAVFHRYGPPEVLAIEERPVPAPGRGEVRVRVGASAVNPKDTFIRKGRFRLLTGRRFPMPTGFDFAGEVDAVGPGVRDVRLGPPVFGMLDGLRGGAMAELVVASRRQLAPAPLAVPVTSQAALPLVSLTALQALRDDTGLRAGERVCINGASGGVGTMAVQIARLLGAHVTAISREAHHGLLRELGAQVCLDYRDVDVTRGPERYDVFFDVFGNRPFRDVKPILTRDGRWVSTVIRTHVFRSVAWTRLSGRRTAHQVRVRARSADLEQVAVWVASGRLRPVIQEVFPLERIGEAHALQETRHARGKIVVRIAPG